MRRFGTDVEVLTEGATKILVPSASLSQAVPPRRPAFFNPRARLNRDFAVIAYSAFLSGFEGSGVFLDGLAGLGARGLRVAKEVPSIKRVVANDANPDALKLAQESAGMNGLDNFEVSEDEACRFLSDFSRRGGRGAIVDIDPFGSPAGFIDCGIRATTHGGVLSVTATDLQVLGGLFQDTCRRRYGGSTIRTVYSDELALRLVLGCIRAVAGRLDIEVQPLFVHSDQHYYRAYVRVLSRRDVTRNLGCIFHCCCGNRGVSGPDAQACPRCGSTVALAGPLWLGRLFERGFVEGMLLEAGRHAVDRRCTGILEKCILESEMPPTYYALDEVASRMGRSPPKLQRVMERLRENGFRSSPTAFEPTGFRTDAGIGDIEESFG